MRISHEEMLDIVGYAIGKQAAEEFKAHYRKYGDFNRIKDKIIQELILDRKELVLLRKRVKEYREMIDRLSQGELFQKLQAEPHKDRHREEDRQRQEKKDLIEAQNEHK